MLSLDMVVPPINISLGILLYLTCLFLGIEGSLGLDRE